MWSFSNFRRLPRSAQAAAVLRGTVFLVCLTLGIWLVLWLLLVRPRVNLVAAVPKASPVALHSLAGLLPPNVDQAVAAWREVRFDSLEEVATKLDEYSSRPVVLYLTAPIAPDPLDSSAKADDHDGNPKPADRVIGGDAIERFWHFCRDRHGETKLLLIIDPGRVGPDPVVGAPGQGPSTWLDRLESEKTPPGDPEKRREWEKKWRNFGIFSACSPKQWSWPVEGQGRTIFDKVLDQSLAKPRKLKKTVRLVEFWVAQLVRNSIKGAVQNPMYVGDPDLDFLIRGEKPRPLPVDLERAARDVKNLWERLHTEYQDRDLWEKRQPYRASPAAWHDYQDHLLRAERLYRARRLDDAVGQLDLAGEARRRLTDSRSQTFGSLALGIRYASQPAEYERLQRELMAHLFPTQSSAAAPEAAAAATKEPKADNDKKSAGAAGGRAATVEDGSAAALFRTLASSSQSERNRWKPYVEGQLIEWMRAYASLEPLRNSASPFGDRKRQERFVRAIGLRIEAEKAAAAAVGLKTSLKWAIEKGDQHLRLAQDLLFIDQTDAQERAAAELDSAETQYRWANMYVAAQDVVQRIEAELDFLGLWYVRHAARLQDRAVEHVRTHIKSIADRTHDLGEKLRLVRSAAEGEDYFRLVEADAKSLDSQYQTIRQSFDSDLRSAEKTSDWRTVDDVLLVPGITAAARETLVTLVRDLPSVHKDDQAQNDAKTAEAASTGRKEAAEAGRAFLTRNFHWWFFEKANSALTGSQTTPSAPEFDLPGIDDEKLEREEDRSYPALAALSATLKTAVREISPLDSATRQRGLDERLQDLMRWMAGRMIADGDAARAETFRQSAGAGDGDLQDRIKPLAYKVWLSPFDAKCGQALDLEPVTLSVDYQVLQGVPEGRACLFVNVPKPEDRTKVELFRGDFSIGRGTEARFEHAPTRIELYVARGSDERGAGGIAASSQAKSTSVALQPIVFYRGREFHRDVDLTVNRVDHEFQISIESDTEEIARRLGVKIKDAPRDQFTKRPNAVTGFAYPGCFHPSLLTIVYRAKDGKDVNVDVEVRHDDGREPEVQTFALKPGKKQIVKHHEISFDNAKPRDPKQTSQNGAFLRQQTLSVSVWLAGKHGKGKPLAQQAIKLSEVNPERFNQVNVWVSAQPLDQPGRLVNVRVYRQSADPVVAPVGIDVRSHDGLTRANVLKSRKGRRESPAKFDPEGRAGLEADEACTYQFELPSRETKAKTYRFDVVFAGHYTMERTVTVEGAAAPPSEAAAPPK